jgi:predicted O-methyltransferase YrrM
MDAERAVCEALEVDAAAYHAAEQRFHAPDVSDTPDVTSWHASTGLQSLISVCIRLLAPDRMVETGVARGYSTAVALQAMHDLSRGQLFSVELPRLVDDPEGAVGSAVPDDLKARWQLTLGPSSAVLPRVLREASPVDIFLHDSDHTYASQIYEYRTAWPHIRRGGLLLSDDVFNSALIDFAREVSVQPRLIGEISNRGAIGMLVKP